MDHQGRYPDSTNARFTEHLNSSPPYPHYLPDQSPEVAEYDAGSTGHFGPPPVNKERQTSAEMSSPGLQSVMDEEGQKEVVPPRRQQKDQQHPGLVPGILGYGSDDEKSGRTYCGLSRLLFFLLLAAIIIIVLGIALGVGLGVGLKNSTSSSSSGSGSSSNVNPEYLIGGAIDPSYYTHTGAFNGSGIALASQSFTKDLVLGTEGSIVMYFQHHSGEIRFVQLSSTGDWRGGSPSEVVAVNAKNSTPLSAVAYSIGGIDTWHIFYVDTDNILRQRTNGNTSNVWSDGPINDLNIKVYDAEQVGMQACYYGNDYGDSDYKHTPLPSQNTSNGNPAYSNQVGMHMWYAIDEHTFQQLGWRDGDDSWQYQNKFHNMNGHAGVGCYSWGPTGTVTYAMLVNEENTVEVFWKDTNSSLTSTSAHPINEWVKSPAKIDNVDPASSLGYTNYFYAQLNDDKMIHGYNITWAAENTTIDAGSEFVVQGDPGIPGTHLSVTAIPNPGGGNSLLVFYQTEGNGIMEYTRDFIAGQWSSVNIPIPNQ